MRERSQSEAYEVLGVARALPLIPLSLDAFEKGEISWSMLKQISFMAKEEKEEAWLSFAKTHRIGELKAEVRDARRNGRKVPRTCRRGLTNLTVNQCFRLTLEEQEILRKAFEKTAGEILAAKGGEGAHPTSEEVLLHLSKRALQTDLPGKTGEGSERRRSIFDVVYQVCPNCPSSHILTEDGPVEVPREHVARIEKEARKVEITSEEMVKGEALPEGMINDLDIPKDVELKVLARFDHSCARCGRRIDLHIHHLIFRSKGGPNEVWNLIPLCELDHACVHGGTLEVFMDSLGELHWRSKADRIELILGDEMRELASVPPVVIAVEGKVEAGGDSASPKTEVHEEPAPQPQAQVQVQPAPSNGTQAAKPSRESEGVAEALQKLGYGKKEARDLVWKALELLSGLGRAPTGDEIFNTAGPGALAEASLAGCPGKAVVFGETFRTSGKFGPKRGEEGETPRKAPRTPDVPDPGDPS